MSAVNVETTNAYWEAVRGHVNPTGSLWRTPEVDPYRSMPHGSTDPGAYERWMKSTPQRRDHVARYSWTITDPASVAFVAEHSRGRLLDPMAGTGWWAHVLAEHGVDTVCSDIAPGDNQWHSGQALWVPVAAAPAAEAVAAHGDRTLFLSWPPYDSPDGLDALRAYSGDRAIVIHEGEGGAIGDDALFAELATHWREVAEHVPVQWFGLHDRITVYDRNPIGEAGSEATPNDLDPLGES